MCKLQLRNAWTQKIRRLIIADRSIIHARQTAEIHPTETEIAEETDRTQLRQTKPLARMPDLLSNLRPQNFHEKKEIISQDA